jgi:hypothetical protein
MRLWSIAITIAAASTIALTQVGAAADMPVKALPEKAIVASNGLYVWVDGSYQSISLPTFNLGYNFTRGPGFINLGPVQSYNPRATGYGLAGAIGYILPYGTLSPAFGSNARAELGVSYVHATDSQSGVSAPSTGDFNLQTLDSRLSALNFGGDPGDARSSLSTDYAAWTGNLKGTSDYRFGAFTVTPMVLVFGGRASNDQDFFQQLGLVGGPGNISTNYNLNSSVHWTDLGARVGLKGSVDAMNWLTLAVGGNIGFASRHASLSATDFCAVITCNPHSGSIDASASATPFLANAELSATARALPGVEARAFVGLNYDSRVPGILGPNWTVLPPGGFSFGNPIGTPAGIKFESETSWYAGGGLTVKFAP